MGRFRIAFQVALVASLAFAAAATAAGPSFDCAKVEAGSIEETVCHDEALSALDRKMADVFGAASKKAANEHPPVLKAEQRGWIKGRNDCWKSDDKRACVEQAYLSRIVELQIQSGQLMVPTPVGYSCREDQRAPVTAVYYDQTDPKSAVITVGDDQVIAFIAPSGSGARYTAANVELWEHQGEVALKWFGSDLHCRVLGGTHSTADSQSASGFERVLELQGVTFRVTATNDSSLSTLRIVPSGLESDNSPIEREVDGKVIEAEVADINADGSPEIYVYVQSAGSGSYGSVVAYSANNRKSLSEIYLPPVSENPRLSKGYMGHDSFAVVENTFVQRFPLYRESDTNTNPTGGTRQLQYKLARGEAGWVLRLDQSQDID